MDKKTKIPVARPWLRGAEKINLSKCIDDNWISSQGDFIVEFEKGFSTYCGVKHGVACANGTVAIHLALVALGVGSGDEVIIPNLTFAATANAVLYTGATPVLVDVSAETWNMDANLVEKAVTKKTKAIIPVHLYGYPCEMDSIMHLAKKYKLYVVEDCAEAHGAMYDGKIVGSFGDISCFSFFANKIITTGEGGMCLTNNKDLADKMRLLRDHGKSQSNHYWHEVVGFNYRMTNMQAAVGVAQMKNIKMFLRERARIEKSYKSLLSPNIFVWCRESILGNVNWLFTVLVPGDTRDHLIKFLADNGIESRPTFIPLHEMSPYQSYIKKTSKYPNSIKISQQGLTLPTFVDLKNEEIVKIVSVVNSFFKL